MKSKQIQEFKETEIGKIPVDWEVTQLENVCTKITDGSHFSPKAIESGTKRIASVKDIENNDFNFNSCKIISDKDFDELERNGCKPVDGDVIFSKDGTMGLTFVYKNIQDLVLLSSIAIIRVHKQMNPYFLNFYLRNRKIQNFLISGYSSGSALPRIVLKDLKKLPVIVPEIEEQKRIVKHLYNLDTKIKNLQNQNKVLEQAAQTIFKSWFVYFDEQTEFEDSELGQIPKGWEIKTLESVLAEFETGGRPKGGVSDIKTGIPSVGAESIVSIGIFDYSKTKFVDKEFFNKMTRGVVKNRDVLLYKDGGKPGTFKPHVSFFGDGFPFEVFAINEHVYRLRVIDELSQIYLYFWLSSEKSIHEMEIKSTGAAIPGLNSTEVKSLQILIPNNSLIMKFDNVTEPLISSIFSNCNKIQKLSNIRNSLLSKYLSCLHYF